MNKTIRLSVLTFAIALIAGFGTASAQITIPSTLDMGTALKEALTQGTTKSSDLLSAKDGFFGDATVKLLFPPEAQKAESRLRAAGQGKLCDNIILSLNRAAEDAAAQAKPIFINAIKQMTLDDVKNILLGPNDAATKYFMRTTTVSLTAAFKPVIANSLNKTGATGYYTQGANIYNKVPFVTKINPDIVDYATQKTIDGLFVKIAAEELNIRQNAGARPSPVMQQVFSFASKAKL